MNPTVFRTENHICYLFSYLFGFLFTQNFPKCLKKCFGIDIVYSFSIVDPAQISVLEKKLLDILYYQNEDVFIRLNNFCSVNAELSNVIAAFSKLYL